MFPLLRFNTLVFWSLFSLIFNTGDPASPTSVPEYPFPNLQQVTPLYQAHAHNDYEHTVPLLEALSCGFTSIEVDIYLRNNELYVSHLPPILLEKDKTLSTLYLEPLYCYFQEHHRIFPPASSRPLILMIDIKSNAEATYKCLKEILLPFQELFSYWEQGVECSSAVKIILSGNRPIEKVKSEAKRMVQLDGRIEDIDQHYPAHLMPIISDQYTKFFKTYTFRKTPPARKVKILQKVSQRIHQQGKTLRLWGSPEQEKIWELLLNNGVDFINSDELTKLSSFFSNRVSNSSK